MPPAHRSVAAPVMAAGRSMRRRGRAPPADRPRAAGRRGVQCRRFAAARSRRLEAPGEWIVRGGRGMVRMVVLAAPVAPGARLLAVVAARPVLALPREDRGALSRAIPASSDTALGRAVAERGGAPAATQSRTAARRSRRASCSRAAEALIDPQRYVRHDDLTGLSLLRALRDVADCGVRVRRLLDHNGIARLDGALAWIMCTRTSRRASSTLLRCVAGNGPAPSSIPCVSTGGCTASLSRRTAPPRSLAGATSATALRCRHHGSAAEDRRARTQARRAVWDAPRKRGWPGCAAAGPGGLTRRLGCAPRGPGAQGRSRTRRGPAPWRR